MKNKKLNKENIFVNREVLKKYNLKIAAWHGVMVAESNYRTPDEDGYFCISQKELCDATKLRRNRQTEIIKQLTADGLITVKRKGVPAKNWYKLIFLEK